MNEYERSVIARFQFDVPAVLGADEAPFADRFVAGMVGLATPSSVSNPHCTSGGKPGCTCDGCF